MQILRKEKEVMEAEEEGGKGGGEDENEDAI